MLAIGGLHGLPLLLYIARHSTTLLGEGFLVASCMPCLYWTLVVGRLLTATVEGWFVWCHIHWMCEGDTSKGQ